MNKDLDTVKYETVEKMLNSLKEHTQLNGRLEDLELSFEFIIGSLFPNILQNIKDALNEEHTKGYIEGLRDGKEDAKDKNKILN